MQTILGSSGVIGRELAKELPKYTDKIRLVSRNPAKVNETDEIVSADLLDAAQTDAAVKGSEVVYLSAGLKYTIKVWREQWPIVMQNTIEACKKHNAKLVFFSNVYPYGLVDGWMTEETPIKPDSEKGRIRAEVENMIWQAVKTGEIKAIIARAADFYGPDTSTSFLNEMIFKNFAKGKSGMWFISDKVKHSFTYTTDAGKATAILGNSEDAYNQTWHLPTDKNVLTIEAIIKKAAAEMGVAPKYTILKKWMISLLGIFMSPVKESKEMLYQNEYDYLFDSSKFEKRFNFSPTSYNEGIKATAEYYKK